MRGLMITAAVAALLAVTSAQAQSLDIKDRDHANNNLAFGSIQQDGLNIPVAPPTGYWSGGGEGGSVEAIISISDVSAAFESGVAVSGGWASASSFSGLDIEIFNNTDGLVEIETFGSTIIPAGFGFYLQNRDGTATDNNIFTGYGQTLTNLTFEDLISTSDGGLLAYSDFEFSVTSNDITLYSLSGYVSLVQDYYGNVTRNLYISDPEALDGFVTAYDNPFAYAFAWDATHIVLPLNALLEQGESQIIQYRTSVTSVTRAECINPTTCLVAYSGFGDPIGRGGGTDLEEASVGLLGGMKMASYGGHENPITGIVFDPRQFSPFEFIDNGGAVPEPATWAMMIMGFGLIGAALRRRGSLSYS